MDIAQNIVEVRSEIPSGVELVAVSKFHPASAVMEAYDAGQRCFGESRVQELLQKVDVLPSDIRWHFIGHLQTNKVRQILPHVSLIHSVDSARLLSLINSEAARIGRRVAVLLQVHVAREETKYGFAPDELIDLVTPELVAEMSHVEIAGVMGMASNVDDEERIREDFRLIRHTFDTLKKGVMSRCDSFTVVSMGMSHDWPIAVSEGADMIRVGTTIFGEREY